MRLLLLGTLAALTLACSGSTPSDPDPVRPDAKTETSADADEDTGEQDSAPEDAGDDGSSDASDASDAEDSSDTGLVCPGEEPEPNGSAPSARPLKAIDDCDSSGSTFKGIVRGPDDKDFWTYKGTDKFGCVVDPTASTKSPVRVCIFPACYGGSTELKKCVKGTKTDPIAGGINGCCSDSAGNVEVEFGCPLVGSSDTADIYMRVDAPTAKACVPYEVSYHF